MRLRITFAKTNAMRYTSHLDLHRTWERTIRRSGLPLAYKQGFNPRPRINLAAALPLGFTSQREVIDIWLEDTLTIPEILSQLSKALPPGIQLIDIQEADLKAPALQSELESADYCVTILNPLPDLIDLCTAVLMAKTLPRERRGKMYDLRPLILSLAPAAMDEHGHQRIQIRLKAQEGATGRPEEVAACLGIAPDRIRVHRTCLNFQDNQPDGS